MKEQKIKNVPSPEELYENSQSNLNCNELPLLCTLQCTCDRSMKYDFLCMYYV